MMRRDAMGREMTRRHSRCHIAGTEPRGNGERSAASFSPGVCTVRHRAVLPPI
jgi:hypothetical protein